MRAALAAMRSRAPWIGSRRSTILERASRSSPCSLHGQLRSVPIRPFIFDEVREILSSVDYRQRFGSNAFRKNNLMGFQFDLEVFDHISVVYLGGRDRAIAHQKLNRNEIFIDEYRMSAAEIQTARRKLTIEAKRATRIGSTLALQDDTVFLNFSTANPLIGKGPLRVLNRAGIAGGSNS